MVENKKPQNQEMSSYQVKQVRNRYSSAGITQREANQIMSMIDKLEKIEKKNNLYVGFVQKLRDARSTLQTLLEEANRA